MNQEQIIQMALDSGMAPFKHSVTVAHVADLERFAAFVAAEEREACAKVCEEGGRDESGRIHVQAWGCAKAIRARGQA